VERCLALYEHEQALLLRYWIVADALWNDKHFAFIKLDVASFHFDSKMTLEYEEKLIFVFVTVPSQ
jgi:hypothetical protein